MYFLYVNLRATSRVADNANMCCTMQAARTASKTNKKLCMDVEKEGKMRVNMKFLAEQSR